ncbi:Hypothetical predicted protein [Cloeon dipterum]|uniref:Uncharacterized protein n=1 Tax=Cloeon dipterum TaxID=197152 RepID=A0A8S1CZY3_9INSE|nr:Hypothetical predicted protein [Cloeon dipterum]
MVKLYVLFALLAVAAAYPVPDANVVGMDQPAVQTFNVEYAVPVDPRYYSYYYPQHAMPVQTRHRRQIGFGGLGLGGMGLGGGMAGAQAQAQAQSQSMSNGMGMGGYGMPFGGLGGFGGIAPGFLIG